MSWFNEGELGGWVEKEEFKYISCPGLTFAVINAIIAYALFKYISCPGLTEKKA